MLHNFKQFNGNFGCNWCLVKGSLEKGTRHDTCIPYIEYLNQENARNNADDDVHEVRDDLSNKQFQANSVKDAGKFVTLTLNTPTAFPFSNHLHFQFGLYCAV